MRTKNTNIRLGKIIFTCFLGGWLYLVMVSSVNLLYPKPDSEDYMEGVTGKIMKITYEVEEALLILGCTLTGTMLAEKKLTVVSSGFTMLAIAHGVFFASTFELDPENYGKAVEIFIGGLILYLPAMIIISNDDYFPKWLRILGILSSLPYIGNAILYFRGNTDPSSHEPIGAISFVLLSITTTFWGIYIRKKLRLEPPE